MMVRTIQHPGVQIQETEIGGYKSTVVMNNAYIMGFTDRGPIYDYSFITTTKEFTKIYGEPQTEAEKYMFIAVQSVLANGGTPIVARMPYDNKQCKAYKALKMKWIDKTDMISPKINTDLASPIIPLSTLTNNINSNKSFKEIFSYDNVTINDRPANEIIDEETKIPLVDKITLPQAVMLLNPYESGNALSNGKIYDELKDISSLKINGIYPSSLNIDQGAVSSLVKSIGKDASDVTLNVYKYDDGMNEEIYSNSEEVTKRFLCGGDEFGTFGNVLFKVNQFGLVNDEFKDQEKAKAELESISGKSWFNETTSGIYLISLYDEVEKDAEISGYPVFNKNELPKYVYDQLNYNLSGILTGVTALSDYFESNKKQDSVSLKFDSYDKLSGFIDKIKFEQPNSGSNKFILVKDEPIGCYNFTSTSSYIVNTSISGMDVYSNVNNIDIHRMLENAWALSGKTGNDYASASGIVDKARFIKSFNSLTGTVDETNPNVFIGTYLNGEPKTDIEFIDTLIPAFENTVNGYIIQNDKITNKILTPEDIANNPGIFKLKGFVQIDSEVPAIEGKIKYDPEKIDKSWAKMIGMEEDVDYVVYSATNGMYSPNMKDKTKYFVNGDDRPDDDNTEPSFPIFAKAKRTGPGRFSLNNFGDFLGSGEITIDPFMWKVKYTASLGKMNIKDVNDDIIIENNWLAKVKSIYNHPAFLNLDEDQYTMMEAKLMETPEMGFKYGLYLDSEDCEISNDQYDDLVTVNQFKAVDRSISKYGQDIDDANFIIVDKQKTVVQGTGGNIGFFTVVIDPFDALKVQRTLVSPVPVDPSKITINGMDRSETLELDHTDGNIHEIGYWAYEANDSWNTIYNDLLDSMDCLQRVRNADGVYIGEPSRFDEKTSILDSWSIPLTGGYYDESISKILMRKFPSIPMADITSEDLANPDYTPSIIDHNFATHVCVAVCKTGIDPSNGKIVVNLVETHFGSLFDETNLQNGRTLFIGDIINDNSDYIEFYRNDYVSAGDAGAYDPPEYRRTPVNQIFIKDSVALRNAAAMRGIDYEDYGCDALNPEVKAKHEAEYYADLHKYNIFEIDKKDVCIYNLHWEANLTSFSRKESQKVIANTMGLYSVNDGTTVNIANNFLIDMDRCIKFIKNVDEIPLHFICDAGLSTVAQFCDNVVWNPRKKTVTGEKIDPVTKKKTGEKTYATTGGWITQPFDPDNDPDGEDRYITGYEDIATWRRVVEKIASIASEIRKDCFAIIDAPRQLTLDGAAPKIRTTKFTNNFDKTIGRCLRYISGINNSYVAGYYNWLRTTDQYTGKSIWIPPTSKIIGNYCYLNINNLPWLAPAGLTYGVISGCHAISHNPDPLEEDQIYMKSWNYIKQYPFDGLIVEGQRTLLGKESVFERVNVRLLFLDLERYAYNVSRTYKYQVNNAYTREQFVATLKPKFEDYTLRGGIYEYFIKVDNENNTPETIDANELRGDIFIKPARLIEFILLNFVGTSTNVNFTELQLG